MDSAYIALAAADDYERNKENYNDNLAGKLIGGAALLGAGALGLNYARSVGKNRVRKVQVNVSDNMPRSGQGGVQQMDLPALPGRGNSSYQEPQAVQQPRRAKQPTSQDALKKFNRDIEGGSLEPDYRPTSGPVTGDNVGKTWQMNRDYYKAQQEGLDLLTDPRTGEIYRRGGSQSMNQFKVAPKNQGGGINLSKQNLMGQGSLTSNSLVMPTLPFRQTTDQLMSFGQRQSRPDVDYVRNRIASNLEAGPQLIQANVQLRDLPPVDRVNQYTRGPELTGYSEGPVDQRDRQHIEASRRNKPQTLVEIRKSTEPFVTDASNEAIQTAEDQSDMRTQKNLQRNEDIDLTLFNEDILDRQVLDAQSYLKRKQLESEIDLKYDYSSEEARQAADVGAALERIRNNPRRVAAEEIISGLQAEGRAERDLARFKSEGPAAGELAGFKVEDNSRQRSQQQGSRAATGEQLEDVLLGESKVIDSSMRGRALRGGKINEEGNYFVEPGTITYVGEGGAETGDFRNASTGLRTDIPYVASEPKTPERAASILASEAVRKQFTNQRPAVLKGPEADVARSMQTLREGMSVEPSEILPSTQVPTINKVGYADNEITIAVPVETQFTGDAADAAGPVLFTGKNKRDSQVIGTSPPLVQGLIRSNPRAAADNEAASQSFLQNAISGGLTQKQTPVSVYTAPVVAEQITDVVVGPGGRRRQLELFGNQPLDTPYLSTGKSSSTTPDPERGPDPSQRTGYARYTTGSKPVGTPSTGAVTMSINYADLPQSDVYRPSDVGRTMPNLSANPAAVSRTMNFANSEAPTRTVYRDAKTGYDYVAHPMQPSQVPEIREPEPISPDASPVRKSYPADPNQTYAPQVLAGRQASVVYPHMRGKSLFSTGTLMNNPDMRGGPVKFEGREGGKDEYVRPINERLGRGDTMQRFPIIRRG